MCWIISGGFSAATGGAIWEGSTPYCGALWSQRISCFGLTGDISPIRAVLEAHAPAGVCVRQYGSSRVAVPRGECHQVKGVVFAVVKLV
jgi:hypothetical protein